MPRTRPLLPVLLVLFFTALAVWGSPFLYDVGNSGRYLVGVLRHLDPALFPGDAVVDSLARFHSLFYDSLGVGLAAVGLTPAGLSGAMFVLYALTRLLTFALLFLLVQTLAARTDPAGAAGETVWGFLFLAALAVHVKPTLLGGTQLFPPLLRHSEAALLLALVGLVFLFRGRRLLFWVCAALIIFVHSIIGLQFVLSVAPPLLLLERRAWRAHLPGVLLLGAAMLAYALFFGPPAMTTAEADIFLAAKGSIDHVSLLNQDWRSWLAAVGVLALATAVYHHLLRGDRRYDLLFWAMVSGGVAGLAISALALLTRLVPLVQIQPMRTFLWVTFFAYLLLALATARAWRQAPWLGLILTGFVVSTILGFIWWLAFAGLGVGYVLLARVPLLAGRVSPAGRDKLAQWGVLAVAAGMLLTGLAGRWLPDSLGDWGLILPAGLLAYLALAGWSRPGARSAVLGLLLAAALLAASIDTYARYARASDDNWQVMCAWVVENTAPTDQFYVTAPAPFRTCAWRPALANDYSAVAWVDPTVFAQSREIDKQLRAALQAGQWDVAQLRGLAAAAGADYIIVAQPFAAPDVPPLFQTGPYALFPTR